MGKKWICVNTAGEWTELGIAALGLAQDGVVDVSLMGQKLALAEKAMQAALEVLSMRVQYFRDIMGQGVKSARHISFMAKQGYDAVFSKSY